ncbi:MAG TPA: MoaD/ThiS family protein [Thermoplasmata archaeon]
MDGRVRILFFSTAREAVGRASLARTVAAEGTRLGALVDALGLEFPRLRPVMRASRWVVNGEYSSGRDALVRPGDEVAIHPPYSGG